MLPHLIDLIRECNNLIAHVSLAFDIGTNVSKEIGSNRTDIGVIRTILPLELLKCLGALKELGP